MKIHNQIQGIKSFMKNNTNSTIKIVICNSYGGWEIPIPVAKILKIKEKDRFTTFEKNRSNPELVKEIELYNENFKEEEQKLKVIEIDVEDIFDYYLIEYDGQESISLMYDDKFYCVKLLKMI